jgi:peptidoglycan/LPS O-acetylase OafA/YrhL
VSAPRGYLPTLDGWRAVAIIGVMAAHAAATISGPAGTHPDAFMLWLSGFGTRGVDLFFGISGFLICSRLLEEIDQRGRIGLRGFYVRRFLRIVPPYALLLSVLALLALAGILTVSSGQLVASLLFVRNYFPIAATPGWYTLHLWSLSVEEHFYLLWPALLALWTPAKARSRVVAFALAIAAWRVVEFRLRLLEHALPGVSFFLRTDIRLDAILWGCWLALLLRDPLWRVRLGAWLSGTRWWIIPALLLAIFATTPPLAMMWTAILVPLMLAGTTLHARSPQARLLELAPLRWIGRLSYSLYLWQQVFFVNPGVQGQLGILQYAPYSLAACFGCAALSYYGLERPMMRLGHRLAPPVTEGRA